MDTPQDYRLAKNVEPPPPYTNPPAPNNGPSTAEPSNRRPSMLDVAAPPNRRRSMLDVAEPSNASTRRVAASTEPAASLPPPPDYTALNTSNTNFRILGTFICAAVTSGEARYQLSTTLDHNMRELRIRRLTSSESRRIVTNPQTPMKFENERTLYTLYMDRWNNAIRLVGAAGEIRVDYSFGRWRVYCMRDKRHEMLYWVRRGRVGLDWEDEEGRAVALETREGMIRHRLKLGGEVTGGMARLL
ncbi:hypothetical protein H2199_004272 [Coniosporium tulheliwenetii]|uniref:Uncharacterized protein n=1 Tax=Coniosporium tulheliwenetii TaxID=3383036 RepID=A0ACC2Z7Q3_9PEZI|nr:hypothetical protein H2199_004272 [Cladosporium sp. JES 115]